MIEGPEWKQDLTYYLVDKQEDLQNMECGLTFDKFKSHCSSKINMEFRILQQMT